MNNFELFKLKTAGLKNLNILAIFRISKARKEISFAHEIWQLCPNVRILFIYGKYKFG